MTENRSQPDPDTDDAPLERALSEAFRASELTAEAMARLHAVVATEWRSVVDGEVARRANRRRRWSVGAVAAGVALLALGLTIVRPFSPRIVMGTLARVGGAGVDLRGALTHHARMSVGDSVTDGDTVTADGPALLLLAHGGSLRMAAGTAFEVSGATLLVLSRGKVLVDLPPGTPRSVPFRVQTHVGTVEHVGTTFEVLSDAQGVRIRVREGRIRLIGAAVTTTADAGTELRATVGEAVERRSVATYGDEWSWTTAMAPDYEIEGRPLISFLEWVARESGRRVDFADPHARDVATRTTLHGSIRGRAPLDALADMLATTTLSYQVVGDTIRVHSAP